MPAVLREAADLIERSRTDTSIHAEVGEHGVVHVRPDPALLGDRPQDVDLAWDFGDPDAPRNRVPGFNAAHVYRKPGRYVVTLVVTRTTDIRVLRRVIEVRESSRRVIEGLPDGPVGDDAVVRFERGQVYSLDRPIEIAGRNVVLEATSVGPPPVLRWAGGRGDIVRCLPGCRDVRIEGLAFEAVGKRGDRHHIATAVAAAGRNVAVIDCRFDQVQDAVNANGQPAGLLLQNCTAGDDLHAYFCWVEGTDIVLLDNHATHSIAEHIVRVGGAERLTCVGNDFTNRRKSCFNVQVAEQAWLDGNTIRGAWALGPLGGGDGRNPADRCTNAVVRRNHADDTLLITHGTQAARVEANVITADDRPAIQVEGFSSDFQRGVADVTLCNNIATNAGQRGNFLRIDGPAESIRLIGNHYLAPRLRPGSHGTATIMILDHDARALTQLRNNHWPDTRPRNLPFAGVGTHYVWPYWSDKRGYITDEQLAERRV
ncbi:MAG: PKD domain-containing protein [Planctomycetota bacterium]